LHAVGLDDLISRLPAGLNTRIGPTSNAFSGGEVQRLGIARILARHPQMVVLDEPTSALDVDSETLVAEAVWAIVRQPGTIVIIIAHRASTLLLCDQVVVLERGRVAAAGPLDSVSKENDFLARVLAAADVSISPAVERQRSG
jgi:ABC-type multidrug transport system fused ATPase/permease subunit